jgi:peptidyl-Lys metalloendopeptidase
MGLSQNSVFQSSCEVQKPFVDKGEIFMRKRVFWSFALTCVMAAGSIPAMAGSLGSAALVPQLSMDRTALTMEDGVNVRFTLANQGADDLLVLKWKTPLAGFEGNLFSVERDGERVAYTGRLVKRAAPRAADYVRIPAGDSVSVTFDLSAVYDMRQPGNYSVRYGASGIDVVREDYRRGQTVLAVLDNLESDTVSLTLSGRDLRGEDFEAVAASPVGGKALTPSYLNCSNSQITSIGSGLTNAQNYATSAYNFLVGLATASRSTNVRYKTWFGNYSSSNYATVQSHFNSLKNAFAGQTFQLNCDCASDNSLYAYVYTNQPYHVHLCGAFFAAPATGTDSKAGTLVHETSHFTVVAGTNDYAYGQTACKRLATKTPNKAINNADSHEYFAENTPFLN